MSRHTQMYMVFCTNLSQITSLTIPTYGILSLTKIEDAGTVIHGFFFCKDSVGEPCSKLSNNIFRTFVF